MDYMEWRSLGKLRWYSFIIFNIILFTTIVFITSCKPTKIIEVPVDKVKIEYKDRVRIDSIIKNDSIIIKDKGDTIFIEKYKYLYRIKERKDTINIRDTITTIKTVEVVREKEINKLNLWQKILVWVGGVTILFLLFKYIIKR